MINSEENESQPTYTNPSSDVQLLKINNNVTKIPNPYVYINDPQHVTAIQQDELYDYKNPQYVTAMQSDELYDYKKSQAVSPQNLINPTPLPWYKKYSKLIIFVCSLLTAIILVSVLVPTLKNNKTKPSNNYGEVY